MDSSNNVIERDVALPGGVLLTKRSAGDAWRYPNVHGDVVATATAAGTKQGATLSYDPFGSALGSALGSVLDNSAGNFDSAGLGQHQRGLEHAGRPVRHRLDRQVCCRGTTVDPLGAGAGIEAF